MDGQLEVIIGDTGGMLYCISAGGTCVPGQVDWPMFHGDLNKTGFYNPGTSYGVKVDRGLQYVGDQAGPEKLTKSVKPGDTASYNLTVQNIGSSKTFTEVDTFWLNIDQTVYEFGDVQEKHEWSIPKLYGEKLKWGYEPGGDGSLQPFLFLATMEKTNLTLEVTAPWSGELSEFSRVEVRAHSANDSFARDNIITETSIEISLDFEIDILKEAVTDKDNELFGQKVIKINPSDKAMVEVELKNKGNLNDTYDLKLEGVIWGWNAYFIDSNTPIYLDALRLDATIMEAQFPGTYRGSEGKLKFAIEAPEDAQENEILTLKVVATSQYSKNSDFLENIRYQIWN